MDGIGSFTFMPSAEDTDFAPVMAGLDPAISYPHRIANDAIPVSNHPMVMAGTCLDMPRHDVAGPFRAVRQSLGPLELVAG